MRFLTNVPGCLGVHPLAVFYQKAFDVTLLLEGFHNRRYMGGNLLQCPLLERGYDSLFFDQYLIVEPSNQTVVMETPDFASAG